MPWKLNVTGFATSIEGQLTGNCKGYSFELRQHGAVSVSKSWGDAIDGALEGGATLPWSTKVRMNIASCSKLITAMALTRILDELHLSPDEPIHPYLPGYWNPGPNVELITFRDVMTQTSGLFPGPSGFSQTYVPCREAVEAGVVAASIGGSATRNYSNWSYQNTNFVLCRILMATVAGELDVGLTYRGPHDPPDGSPIIIVTSGGGRPTQEQADDALWDYETTRFYERYIRRHIFEPAGVKATLSHPDEGALAYGWNVNGTADPADNVGDGASGWNDGDIIEFAGNPDLNSVMLDWAGPSAWHMSVSDLLDVMGTFRRAGTIMSTAAANAMLEDLFGIDWGDNGVPQESAAGPIYIKNGGDAGSDGAGNTAWEQSGALFFPLDMECVALVNSSVWPSSFFLLTTISDAFVSNLTFV